MRAPEFWTSTGLVARACAALLAPLGALYGLSVRARQAGARPFRARARVLCVGNLTVGGSGKTPVAMALARMLAERGRRVVFLSRGYGGRLIGPIAVDPGKHRAEDVGDEPLLLAAFAPTVVALDRARGAQLADSLGAQVIVMDDGFQNFKLAKDLSLVVIDAETGFGNGRVIPAGPLREPVEQGLQRADAVVAVGDAAFALPSFRGPVFRAQFRPSAPSQFSGRAVFAMAGIGRPEKLFHTLQAMGAVVVGTKAYPDHHEYTARELESVKNLASGAGAIVVTTEKDFVRIAPPFREGIVSLPVHAVFEDDSRIRALLDRLA
jgi:tetraacyldisaccharide 4'-kinase